ncbi:MAG: 4Fe-4S binding protein [Patescibacteria group bacterium]|jgi:Fe-S-cluster-containing hydrogenase component 2
MPIRVDKSKCPQNHPCPAIKVCPVEALSQRDFNAPEVDMDKCLECGACSNFCPMGALRVE